MKLNALAERIGAKILTPQSLGDVEVERVYAGDRMSDLLNEASDRTLLVTHLTGPQLLRLAELMDVPGICLVKGGVPEAEMVRMAGKKGMALLVSPVGMFETCGRLYECLGEEGKRG